MLAQASQKCGPFAARVTAVRNSVSQVRQLGGSIARRFESPLAGIFRKKLDEPRERKMSGGFNTVGTLISDYVNYCLVRYQYVGHHMFLTNTEILINIKESPNIHDTFRSWETFNERSRSPSDVRDDS